MGLEGLQADGGTAASDTEPEQRIFMGCNCILSEDIAESWATNESRNTKQRCTIIAFSSIIL